MDDSLSLPVATQDWHLGARRTLSLNARQIRSLTPLRGDLWVTFSGDPRDFFLAPGETQPVPCDAGQVVIEAIGGEATVQVSLAIAHSQHAPALSLGRALAYSGGALAASVLRRIAGQLQSLACRLAPTGN